MKTSWRCLEDVLRTSSKRLENVLKISWRRFCKTSWRRLENVLKTYSQDEYIGLDQDVFWRRKAEANIFVLIKTSYVFRRRRRKTSSRRLHDVFIKTNVCWVTAFIFSEYTRLLFSKRLWKFTSTISFRKYKGKVVIYLFNYDSSKSTFFMLNMAFDVFLGTVFVT